VGTTRFLALFRCYDDSLALRNTESECPSLAGFISLS
jgi:hypothetical protein